jgi:hypothetical protein
MSDLREIQRRPTAAGDVGIATSSGAPQGDERFDLELRNGGAASEVDARPHRGDRDDTPLLAGVSPPVPVPQPHLWPRTELRSRGEIPQRLASTASYLQQVRAREAQLRLSASGASGVDLLVRLRVEDSQVDVDVWAPNETSSDEILGMRSDLAERLRRRGLQLRTLRLAPREPQAPQEPRGTREPSKVTDAQGGHAITPRRSYMEIIA